MTSNDERPTRRTWTFRLGVLAISSLVVLVAAELALRRMLFGSAANATARRLRQAEWYTPGFDADYWKLQATFARATARPPPNGDALLGWTGDVEPATYAHPDAARVGDRDLVLLYGDSYAECVTPPEECWQGLLERSEFGSERALLNYGVRGYGLDQAALMLERTLPRYAARAPTVLIGVFVDDDLERCDLALRGWPKPRFEMRHDRLELAEPGLVATDAWLERHPPEIPSYALRLLRRAILGSDSFSTSWTDESTLDERRAVCRAILERIAATLDAHGVRRRAFVLFESGASFADTTRTRWQRELVRDFARERGIACVSTAPYLTAATGGDTARIEADLMTPPDSFHAGHYDELGNRVAFEAILEALRIGDDARNGDAVPRDETTAGVERVRALRERGELVRAPRDALRYTLLGRPLYCRAARGENVIRVQDASTGPSRLSLRPSTSGDTEIEIELRGARRLRASARALDPSSSDGAPLLVAIESAGGEPSRLELAPNSAAIDVDAAVGGDRVRIRVDRHGPSRTSAWVVLDALRLDAN